MKLISRIIFEVRMNFFTLTLYVILHFSETPCWIEIQLHRALQLADELLHSIPVTEHHRRLNSHMND